MSLFAGIDMSAHTTSLALVDDEINTVANKRILRLYHPGILRGVYTGENY